MGDDKDGKATYDVGYMAPNVGNIHSGKMSANDGSSITVLYMVDGAMGTGLSEAITVSFGMSDTSVLMNSVGDHMSINVSKGDGPT